MTLPPRGPGAAMRRLGPAAAASTRFSAIGRYAHDGTDTIVDAMHRFQLTGIKSWVITPPGESRSYTNPLVHPGDST